MKKTSISELSDLFAALGVGDGDVVMLHSTVFTLGLIEDGLLGLYEALQNRLGVSGTLIVPTFTYSFRRQQIFDVRNTPVGAEIGAFAEFVRKLPGVIRSADPLFSMSAVGPQAEKLMTRTSHECFGQGSIYEKLFDVNALFIALGITYSTGITAFMHLECLANVDYRCKMRFDGMSIGYDGIEYPDWALHFARNEARYPFSCTNRDPLGYRMEQVGISKAMDFGSGHHMALRAQPFQDYVLSELARNPHSMLIDKMKN
jgi:aminoglycoside 3-N-acetyltransferase